MKFQRTFNESILVIVSFTKKQNQKSRQTELILDFFVFLYSVYSPGRRFEVKKYL